MGDLIGIVLLFVIMVIVGSIHDDLKAIRAALAGEEKP